MDIPKPTDSDAVCQSTSWTTITEAGNGSEQAWVKLVRIYSKPVLAHLKRKGLSDDDAKDLLQILLYNWFRKEVLRRDWGERRQGRFRSFLFDSVNNLLVTKIRSDKAGVRGGGKVLSLELENDAGQSIGSRLAGGSSPSDEFQKDFDRDWWQTLLLNATRTVKARAVNSKHAPLIPHLLPVLFGESNAPCYQEIACRFQMTEENVRKSAERLRAHIRKEIRERLLETCRPEEVDDELNYFLSLGLGLE